MRAMRFSATWPVIAAIGLALALPGVCGAQHAVEAAGPGQPRAAQQPKSRHVGDKDRLSAQVITKGPQYVGTTDPDNEAINQAWQDAGQPSPFNPKTTPALRDRVENVPSYGQAKLAAEVAIKDPDSSTAAQSLWDAADAIARETNGNIMEVLHLIMIESIKEDNETKRMVLRRLDMYNKIDKALSESLRSLADASRELAARENKDEADAKTSIGYWRYDTNITGSDGEILRTTHISKRLTRTQLGIEMKTIENDKEQVRYLKQKAQNEFQHMDQVVNQEMQGISRLMRALGALRTQIGLAGQKY